MSRYITNKKPSLVQQFLTTLGFQVSPQKVNCWYCCQDSFLLPGSKNTVNHWYCNLCESTNIRDKNGEIADPTVFEASSTRNIPSIERSPSSIQKNSSRTLCSDCVANQETIYQYLADYIPDESDPTYQIKFNDVDEYKAKLHQRYKLCNDCQQKITKLNEEQREIMRRIRFTASVFESTKPQTLVRPSQNTHKLKGSIWAMLHVFTVIYGAFYSAYPPQGTNFHVSSKMMQFYKPEILQEWTDYLTETCKTLLDPVRCVFSRSDEFCFWDVSYQHVIILAFMTVVSFVVRNWHHLLLKEAPDKLKHYGFYKNVQKVLILLRWVLFFLIAMNASQTWDTAILCVYCSLLVVSYSVVRCAIWPYTLIGKSRREEVVEEVEEEEDDTAEPMDIVPDNPSLAFSPAQQQHQPYQQQQQQQPYHRQYHHQYHHHQPDAVDSLVDGLHQIAF